MPSAQGSLKRIVGTASLDWTSAALLPDLRVQMSSEASSRFLDNASSRWDWVLHPWPCDARYTYRYARSDHFEAMQVRQHPLTVATRSLFLE